MQKYNRVHIDSELTVPAKIRDRIKQDAEILGITSPLMANKEVSSHETNIFKAHSRKSSIPKRA